jgi:hypothetical protein
VRKVIARNANGYAALKDGKPEFLDKDGINGQTVILEKLEMVREWLQKEFNTNLEDLRREVQSRTFLTNPDGSFVKKDGQFVNRLVSPLPSNPQQTLIDSLVNEVNKFKGLIIKK